MRKLESILYTAEVTATGGREGNVKSSDGTLDLRLVRPPGLGGDGTGGTNPEQLFAAGYAGCFESALRFIARQRGVTISRCAVTAQVSIGKAADGGFGLAVELNVDLPGVAREQATEIVQAAHQTCPYSHATRGNIEVKLAVI